MKTASVIALAIALLTTSLQISQGQALDPLQINLAPPGTIDSRDLEVFSLHWQESETHFGSVPGDYDQDGRTEANDLVTLLSAQGLEPTIELINVPAGTFIMGRRDDGDDVFGIQNCEPRHRVNLSEYQIGKYEVTVAQYADVLNWAQGMGYLESEQGQPYQAGDVYSNGQVLLQITDMACQISFVNGAFVHENRQGYSMADHPIDDVTWYGAVAFCNWLSEREGRVPCYTPENNDWVLTHPHDGGYRLPSEAEWERAAGWDGSKRWLYGMTSDTAPGTDRCNYVNTENYPVFIYTNPLALATYPYTSPVGWFNGIHVSPNGNVHTIDSPSPIGCYDMSGNASEWCEDLYHEDYLGAPVDGSAWMENPVPYLERIVRGGGASYNLEYCRTSERDRSTATYDAGFRLARTPVRKPTSPPAPIRIRATMGATAGTVHLSWFPLSGAAGYRVFYEEGAGGPPYIPAQDGTPASGSDVGNKTSESIHFLAPDTVYHFAVQAYNAVGDSPYTYSVAARSGHAGAPGEVLTIELPTLPEGTPPLRLIRLPAGSFQLGSPDTERGRDYFYEGPVHSVTLTTDFYIGETEVTQGQWWAVMGYNPAFEYGTGNGYPVYNVSWNDILLPGGFMERLDEQTVYGGYRLPTEAEWEYACRAGTQTRFSFGDSLDCEDNSENCAAGVLSGNRSNYMWFKWSAGANGFPMEAKPVASLLPNQWGLFDMHGNVQEWCQDWYSRGFYGSPEGAQPDPLAIIPGENLRVTRGGDWRSRASFCRSAPRFDNGSDNRWYTNGFRVVLALNPLSE